MIRRRIIAVLLVCCFTSWMAQGSQKGPYGQPAAKSETDYIVELYDLGQLSEDKVQDLVHGEGLEGPEDLYEHLVDLDGAEIYNILSNATSDPDYRPFCAGSIIADGTILTAAQCVVARAANNTKYIFARSGAYYAKDDEIGDKGGKGAAQEFRFAKGVKVHPDYPIQPESDEDTIKYYAGGFSYQTNDAAGNENANLLSAHDIALVMLQSPFDAPYSIDIATADDLPLHNSSTSMRPVAVPGRQVLGPSDDEGWGEVFWQRLFEMKRSECSGQILGLAQERYVRFVPTEDPGGLRYCAQNFEYEEGCQVDIGAPAVVDMSDYTSAQIGVVVLGCDGYNRPAFFVNLLPYWGWINANIVDSK